MQDEHGRNHGASMDALATGHSHARRARADGAGMDALATRTQDEHGRMVRAWMLHEETWCRAYTEGFRVSCSGFGPWTRQERWQTSEVVKTEQKVEEQGRVAKTRKKRTFNTKKVAESQNPEKHVAEKA